MAWGIPRLPGQPLDTIRDITGALHLGSQDDLFAVFLLYGCNVKPIHIATGTCHGTVSFTQSKQHDILQNILNQKTNRLALPSPIVRDSFQYSASCFLFSIILAFSDRSLLLLVDSFMMINIIADK